MRNQMYSRLEGMAKSKAEGVSNWLIERSADIDNLSRNHATKSALASWLEQGDDGHFKSLTDALAALTASHLDITQAAILGPDGRHLLGTEDIDDSDLLERAIAEVGRTRTKVFIDLHERRSDGSIRVGYLAPIMDPETADRINAVAVVEMDPSRFLFPFIDSIPIATTSGETLLVERSGGDVLYINLPRHRTGKPSTLKMPMGTEDLPAARGLRNEFGHMSGTDYRGIPVLADVEKIPGTSWILVAKVDQSEVLSEIHRRGIAASISLLFVLLAGLGFLRQHQLLREARRELTVAGLLEQANRRYRGLFENMLEGCAICEMVSEGGEPGDIVIVDINDGFQRLTGLGDVRGRRMSEILPGIRDTDPAFLEVCARAAAGGAPQRQELHLNTLGKWLSLAAYHLDPTCFVVVFTDETRRHQDEQDLRESEEHLRLAQDVAGIGTWEWTPATNKSQWSAECCRQHGLEAVSAEITHADALAIIHPQDRERVASQLEKSAENGRKHTSEHRVVWPDGQIRWISGIACPIVDPETDKVLRVIGVVRDTTERRALKDAETRARSEALHLERLSAIGAVSSMIAHEVNQPLGTISNYIQTAMMMSPDRKIHDVLGQAVDQIQRMASIIAKVKGFAAKRRPDRQPVAIRPLIEDSCTLGLLIDHERRIEVRVDTPDDLPEILADRVLIEQILVNLIRNAAEALQETNPARIQIVARPSAAGDMLEFAVADNGPGIAAEMKDKLFQSFITTKPNGTGLGLSTSSTIVHAQGGDIWAEPGPDGGAIFRFTLPLIEASHG